MNKRLREIVGCVLIGVLVSCATPPTAANPPAAERTSVVASTRGRVVPIRLAQVGTINGGVVLQVSIEIGDTIMEQQEIARVRGASAGAVEIVSSPFAGTVTDILVHFGDTVLPGAIVASVADLHRLQVETSDVDEYVIGAVRRGQSARLTVDALDRLELNGVVRAVSLVPRVAGSGDQQYPVIIDLYNWPESLRPGMTVKITFEP